VCCYKTAPRRDVAEREGGKKGKKRENNRKKRAGRE